MPRKKVVENDPAPVATTLPPSAVDVNAALSTPDSPLTNDELVAEAIAIDDYCKGETKRLSEFLAKYRTRSEEIDKILLARMINQGMPNIVTNHGTAYKSTIVTPKVVDREIYLDLVLDERNYETFGRGMLQVGPPQKASLDEYIERRKREITEYQEANEGRLPNDTSILPPGVETSSYTRVNIKRS